MNRFRLTLVFLIVFAGSSLVHSVDFVRSSIIGGLTCTDFEGDGTPDQFGSFTFTAVPSPPPGFTTISYQWNSDMFLTAPTSASTVGWKKSPGLFTTSVTIGYSDGQNVIYESSGQKNTYLIGGPLDFSVQYYNMNRGRIADHVWIHDKNKQWGPWFPLDQAHLIMRFRNHKLGKSKCASNSLQALLSRGNRCRHKLHTEL
jgi:hypothetical protein